MASNLLAASNLYSRFLLRVESCSKLFSSCDSTRAPRPPSAVLGSFKVPGTVVMVQHADERYVQMSGRPFENISGSVKSRGEDQVVS